MKIFFMGLSLSPSSGGIEKYCWTNLNYLAQQGHEIYYYCLQTDSTAPLLGENIHWVNPEVPRIKLVDRLFRAHRLASHLKDKQIDVIFCGHLHMAPAANRLAKRLKLRFDLFVYGIDCWGGRMKDYAPSFTHLRHIISISSFTTGQVVNQGMAAEKIVYLPPVVKVGPLEPVGRREKSEKFVLLTVGRLSPEERYKGHDKVIEAVHLLADRYPALEYWIAGRGGDRPRLEKMAQDYRLQDRVKFLGFVPDEKLEALYRDSDVFIMPSRVDVNPERPEGEGFGIVFLEAALHQRPLIGPSEGGSMDIIEHGKNGLLADPRSAPDLAQKIEQLLLDRGLCERLGKGARKTVEEKFSFAQLGDYFRPLLAGATKSENLGWTKLVNPFKIEWLEKYAQAPQASQEKGRVLDLGAGAGHYSRFFARKGFEVTAIDQQILFADSSVKTIEGSLEGSLPLEDNSFDLVLAWDIIEHVQNEDLLISEIKRVLKPQGRVILSVPHADDGRIAASYLTFAHFKDKTHFREYLPESLDHLFASRSGAGMRKVKLELVGGNGYPYVLLCFIDNPLIRFLTKAWIFFLRKMRFLRLENCHGDIFAVYEK